MGNTLKFQILRLGKFCYFNKQLHFAYEKGVAWI